MQTVSRSRLRTLLREQKKTGRAVSLAVGDNAYLVRDILSGKSANPRSDTLTKIADELGVDVNDLMDREAGTRRNRRLVPLVGYVGAGAEAHYYATGDSNLGEVEAPDDANDATVAVEIRGTSLGPLFESWLVFYDEVRRPVTSDLYGKLCVVGLPDDRILVKRIRPARTHGYFHLESNNEPTMPDELLAWAAKVKGMTPR